MQGKSFGNNWQKSLWKFVTNPMVEVVAAIVAVLLAAWIVVATEVDMRNGNLPIAVPFVSK